VLVLSGGTRLEDLERYAYRPEIVVDSLAELAERLERTAWRPLGMNGAAGMNGHRPPVAAPRKLASVGR
jgi:NagD protein